MCIEELNCALLFQVYKVLFAYSPQKDDELELLEGDYVYVSTSDQGQTGTQEVKSLPIRGFLITGVSNYRGPSVPNFRGS